MKCHICDRDLASDEIKHTPEHGRGNFAPCGTCQEVIDSLFEPPSEEEIDRQLVLELFYEELQEETNNNESLEEENYGSNS